MQFRAKGHITITQNKGILYIIQYITRFILYIFSNVLQVLFCWWGEQVCDILILKLID